MSKPLFNDFEAVSAKQWKQKIQFDLKGADYNNTLVWNTNDDISVKPFYHSDDFKEFPTPSNTKATQWNICETIFVADVEKSNLKAIEVLSKGIESLKFIIPSNNISLKHLLQNIDTSSIPVYLELQFLSKAYFDSEKEFFNNSKVNIQIDIVGNLAKSGNWFKNINDDFLSFKSLVSCTNSILVDATLYQNAGANTVQQLAYAIAHANEYLNALSAKDLSKITFNVAIGSNYFFEIAKLRALKLLWQTVAVEYGINVDCHIFAVPSKRNKTIYDYNNNLLRTTTECMSAILGGANTICNLAYDSIYKKSNEFGDRIARNQLLILKNESYFNKVNNPSDGAYYIETLTNQLAQKSLELFKNIEANGGFLKQLKNGTIQRKIEESATKEQNQFDIGEHIILGANKYPDEEDKIKDQLEIYPFVKINRRKTLIKPIIEKRLAENLEQQRLKTEN